ncbi:MAG: polymerase subunit sigma-24 [Frankiales bacterium]|jgi:RNA polymerase sigma-70 factor (ECF subfamily)|nr:polymerase subunit sigma-24 [Frankiales bacterium]
MQRETAAVERVFREEYGLLIASLVRRFGDIDIAEEAAGEALVAALEKWPEAGVPPNPGGWLTITAGNRAIDRIRREKQRDAKHQAALMYYDDTPHEPTGPVEDDRLRLLFTCCHPALASEARIALTLRLLGGLTVAEIAQAFLVPETTMAQRITRAKTKIAAAKVPYRVPGAADLPGRLDGVLAVLFLVFKEGYLATGDGDPVRADLTGEAIRLTRILRRLLPDEPEVAGLLGLLLLIEARREARVRDGQLVPLAEQDRGSRSPRWTVRSSPSRWSTGCPSRATTHGTPSAPISCAGSVEAPRRRRRTTRQSPPPRTPPNAPTSAGSAASWSEPSWRLRRLNAFWRREVAP